MHSSVLIENYLQFKNVILSRAFAIFAGFIISPLTKITVYSYHRRTPSVLCHPLESSSRKMASTSEEGTHWAQVIFTYDSRPPVLIDKEQITLGRKEGKRTGYERRSIVKNDYFTL